MKLLNKAYNIYLLNQEEVPEDLRRGNLIIYLPPDDRIVISGWGNDTKRILDVIIQFMEAPSDTVLNLKLCDETQEVWRILKEIRQIRNTVRYLRRYKGNMMI